MTMHHCLVFDGSLTSNSSLSNEANENIFIFTCVCLDYTISPKDTFKKSSS